MRGEPGFFDVEERLRELSAKPMPRRTARANNRSECFGSPRRPRQSDQRTRWRASSGRAPEFRAAFPLVTENPVNAGARNTVLGGFQLVTLQLVKLVLPRRRSRDQIVRRRRRTYLEPQELLRDVR
jgi:hypothetical protein